MLTLSPGNMRKEEEKGKIQNGENGERSASQRGKRLSQYWVKLVKEG